MAYIVAVDTGGTFSDCVIVDGSGRVIHDKAPSTPHDFSHGALASVERAAQRVGLSAEALLAQADLFEHGTTVSTNALITRRGARVGLITTKGHEDTIIIGRIIQKVAGLTEEEIINIARLDKADPIVPRPMIRGITERIDVRGDVVVPLNESEVVAAAQSLVDRGAEAIAVSFLWSFVNPSHEQRVREIIHSLYPSLMVSIASDLAPVIQHYERTATAAINSYVGPGTSRYLGSLQRELSGKGLRNAALVMGCAGGVMTSEEAGQKAVATIQSGPVGGVIGSRALGKLLGHANIITTDVGGTSFDVGIVTLGEAQFGTQPVFEKYHVAIPVIDVVSVGAGGGSIAWLEPGTGLLKVGPQSAGAAPGPVCYGTGGTEPTVTDADVVLGRIDPEYFLGRTMRLDRDKAVAAIEEKIAGPMRVPLAEAALGIVDIVDARMADLVRKVTIRGGYDPRQFVLYAFGGAGPTHVGGYARAIGTREVVIPRLASVFSAFGIAGADLIHIKELSHPMAMPGDPGTITQIFQHLEEQVVSDLTRDGISPADMVLVRTVDLRFRRQVHQLRTPAPLGVLTGADQESALERFGELYEQRYGQGTAYRAAGIEAITFRVQGTGQVAKPLLPPEPLGQPDASPALKGGRLAYFRPYGEYRETPVYDGERLLPGNQIQGPAIIEKISTTVVVHPGDSIDVDAFGNLLMKLS